MFLYIEIRLFATNFGDFPLNEPQKPIRTIKKGFLRLFKKEYSVGLNIFYSRVEIMGEGQFLFFYKGFYFQLYPHRA